MTFTDIEYAKSDGVATIAINRPEVLNAFRTITMEELIDAFEDANQDETIGVIVLRGAGGRAFSTGGDIKWEADFTPARGRHIHDLSMRLSHAIRDNGRPVIAAVDGYCIGGGNELNMLCDLTIATESAIFGQAGPRMGSVPVWFSTQLLPRTVGEKRAREIVYFCRQYSASEALAMGWVNAVVPTDEFESTINQWCQDLLDMSPQALRLAKFSLNAESDRLVSGVNQGYHALTLFYNTEEFKEGCAAFIEKRPAEFRRFRVDQEGRG